MSLVDHRCKHYVNVHCGGNYYLEKHNLCLSLLSVQLSNGCKRYIWF